jgi:hypothetical protein
MAVRQSLNFMSTNNWHAAAYLLSVLTKLIAACQLTVLVLKQRANCRYNMNTGITISLLQKKFSRGCRQERYRTHYLFGIAFFLTYKMATE